MKSLNTGIILLALLVSLILITPAFTQAPEQPAIRAIDFRGIEHLPADEQAKMKAAVKLQIGQPYNDETANADREALQEMGWFFRVEAPRKEPMEGGVKVVFTVVENPVITSVTFIGNSDKIMSDDALQQLIKTKSNQLLNRNWIKPDAEAIEAAYANKGYTEVRVSDINITKDNVLEFYIFEPKIGEVRIEGNSKTKDYVIRRQLYFKPGDVYNVNAITESLGNLEKLNIFQEVRAVPEPGTEPGTLIVALKVTERRTGSAALGVGHSNIQGLIGFVDIADTNLFGSGQSLSARVQFGADDSYQLSYTNPWLDDHRTRFTMNVYDRKILRQAVQVDQTFLYDEKRTGGNITVGRPVNPKTNAFVTFRADHISAKKDDADVPPELLEGADVRSISLSMVKDDRDNFLNPTTGLYLSGATEFAGFGGSDFTKLTGEARRYWNLKGGSKLTAEEVAAGKKPVRPLVLASRLSVGTIAGAPPFLDQFLIGGADTLRGYKEDRFPGKNMVLMNNELRLPINDSLQAVTFVDFGDAWGGRFSDTFGDNKFKLHTGYGVGIRVNTPIGPLRLDYGLNDSGGQEFHFGVGSTF